ncbi:suppressor of fused domain protein [Pseudobacteroides cellulosolvens]|uniref:Suppressor of fused-like domain-containing protein n=1 Tax=Pseudobacteroides cellulosolvens ATCC 35603 = DSM 2933 TaxID=398512 RepID=A0A0L6JX04_9FIRM|nr:suppressor of fused domain protein [Pseudobacteroides cellulosolvens]KNY29972.1 hypothetical protein Bccel_5249 [Pseudobacteroides cellulosolvens ATCC 35603 = DSM 2933]
MNLTGIWVGGCLIQIYSEKLNGLWVTSSFGLTNSDMPAKSKLERSKINSTDGKATSFEQVVVSRLPRKVPEEWAGYGYEIVVLAKEKNTWPYGFLNNIVQMEIFQDVGILERVYDVGALTVEKIRISMTDYCNFLICIPPEPIQSEFILPNGKGRLLIAMSISDSEMNYAIENGQTKLLELFISNGIPLISDLNREPII